MTVNIRRVRINLWIITFVLDLPALGGILPIGSRAIPEAISTFTECSPSWAVVFLAAARITTLPLIADKRKNKRKRVMLCLMTHSKSNIILVQDWNATHMATKVYLSPKLRSFEFTVDGFKGFFTRCIDPSASHIISYS